MSDIKHFEQLWCEAEELSSANFKGKTDIQILEELSSAISAFDASSAVQFHTEEARTSYKSRLIGRMLFVITTISHRENINVYAALQDEMAATALISEGVSGKLSCPTFYRYRRGLRRDQVIVLVGRQPLRVCLKSRAAYPRGQV